MPQDEHRISKFPTNHQIRRSILRSWNLRSMDAINTFARLVLASWPQRRLFISYSSYQRLSGALSIYTVARVYSLLLSLSSCFLSLSDHRVLSGEGYIPRNFRVVSTVIGKRLIGERPALIMTVESARLEASSRAWRRATPSRLSLHALADLLRFSSERILDGNATTRSSSYSFRSRLTRARARLRYCRLRFDERGFMGNVAVDTGQ